MSTEDEPLARAIAALNLQEQQHTDGRSSFRGESLDFPTGRLYGGQLLGQTIIASGRTVPEGRLPHSMHAYYLRTGLLGQDVQAEVETIRDGHSFSSRRVDLHQGERTILNALLSYQQIGQEGIRYADPMPISPLSRTTTPIRAPSTYAMLAAQYCWTMLMMQKIGIPRMTAGAARPFGAAPMEGPTWTR